LVSLGLAIAGTIAGTTAAQTPPTHHHDFVGAEEWAGVFDDPSRDEWQRPHQVMQALDLAPDATVADIGSGTGYFTVRLAHFVPKGRVYGVDIEPDMVKYLSHRAESSGLANVTAVAGKLDDPMLPSPVDRVLLVDTYHHIGNRASYFSHLRASLNPGARVAIIDFNAQSTMGPPVEERLPPTQVTSEMESAGYTLLQHHDFLPNQYFLVFAPQ
jgi:cyclopropane fatty-acyl-phospholipid synthase-like methyltransferase